MSTPRPHHSRKWTWADHQDNEQRIQRTADQRTWTKLGRLIGVRGRDLQALLARFMDDRIAAALRAQITPLLDQLKNPDQADALRNAIGDLMCDDIAAMVEILTAKGRKHDRRDAEEIAGSGGPHAATHEREIQEGDPQEWEGDEEQGD